MATYTITTGNIGAHITLAAGVVDTVNFFADLFTVEVISDGTAAVYYTLNGSTPTVGGSNCYVLPAGNAAVDTREPPSNANTVVKLISSGTPTVHVQRGNY